MLVDMQVEEEEAQDLQEEEEEEEEEVAIKVQHAVAMTTEEVMVMEVHRGNQGTIAVKGDNSFNTINRDSICMSHTFISLNFM